MEENTIVSLASRYNYYLANTGIKQTYIARDTNIASSVLSAFRHGKKDLTYEDKQKLETYLTKAGY